ncbi:hypothetical protein H8I69_18535 [Serratia fonticola]|uniref:hypothetical protein n=1 Tax=Serratia fonticola TaxID=47917 RepID=UPI0015C65BA0|nr:hypothetical protein [Serratia fonticola]MBC3381121.1 hypothetical protein [Serratia fonticola]NYA40320.1 hypothetical protein [Serratia fonticola]
MKKTALVVATLVFALVGCDEKHTVKQTISEGNFTAKQEALSSGNKADIKADLAALNAIVNASNSAAVKMKSEMFNAAQKQDQNALKAVLESAKANIEKANQQLVALNIKSKEIQGIRVKMVAGNKMAAELIEMSKKGASLSDEEKSEMMSLQKKSVAMQMDVGQQLNEFNKE